MEHTSHEKSEPPLAPATSLKCHLPHDSLVTLVIGKIRALEPGTEVWMVSFLALFLGLRREEIVFARWSWFMPGTTPRVCVIRDPGFAPKHDRMIEIQPWVFDAIMAFRSAERVHVLPGDEAERTRTAGKTKAFLRGCGISARKPLYELRMWFGIWLVSQRGMSIAQQQLGQSSPTVERHYRGIHFPQELAVLWTEVGATGVTPSRTTAKPFNGWNSSTLEDSP